MSQSSPAALNNEAVSLLQNGSFNAAMRTLKLAANSLVSSPDASPTSLDPNVPLDVTDDGNNATSTVRSVSICRQQTNQNSAASCEFLFQRALIVSERETSLSLTSSVSFYNLALIHHLMGVQHCSNTTTTKKLITARKLYRVALDLVKRHCEAFGNKKALLLSLAIANNLGEIHLSNDVTGGDADEGRKCFALSCQILRSLDPLRDTDLYSQDGDSVFSFFYLNAMVRGTGDIVVAAAA